ncbi:hypothetical protein [Streptomyces sp. NPDC056169]|uniref:hypothetical protein n=1 Tax=Streptomyces sp. NPDC056169 TaxID=3345734 RepID=UPI0035DC3004
MDASDPTALQEGALTEEAPEPDMSSETLLTDLAQIHTRTVASPLPRDPGLLGWQMTAGALAAGFSVALHELAQLAPEQAERVAAWYHGPFGDGPNAMAYSAWAEKHVAGSPEKFQEWVADARERATRAQQPIDGLAKGASPYPLDQQKPS